MAKRTAIIDIGSNSVRIAIYEKSSRFAFHLLKEAKSRVRISEDAYENDGYLQDKAIERTLSALRDFQSIIQSYKVRKTLCVATSAVRDAKNSKEFISRVQKEIGIQIKVIEGKKEAFYGGLACANLLTAKDGVTIDIGGGSTECACIVDGKVVDSHSLNLGTVRLKELYFDYGKIDEAKNYIDKQLELIPASGGTHIYGVGGTLRALSSSILNMSDYPLKKLHGFNYDIGLAKALAENILETQNPDELEILGIKPERFDVIKPGALIFLRIIKHFDTKEITTSGVGVREGVFLSDLLRHNNYRFPVNFNPSVRNLLDKHEGEQEQSTKISDLSKKIFDLMSEDLGLDTVYRRPLVIASKLSKIGESLHFYSFHQHSYYLIQSALEYGFSHQEVMLISTLARYQKRKRLGSTHRKKYRSLLPPENQVVLLSAILSIANALLAHRPRNIDFTLVYEDKKLLVSCPKHEMHLAQEKLKAIEIPKEFPLIFS